MFVAPWADVFQVIFEDGAVLILVKEAVLGGAAHRAFDLCREHYRVFIINSNFVAAG